MRRVLVLVVFTVALAAVYGESSPPDVAFSPPPASGAPSLHAASAPPGAKVPVPPRQDSPVASTGEGWDTLRREALPGPVGSPASQAWRWLLGLAVALVLIKWGLPRAMNGGSKGQVAQWLTRLASPQSEGTITVLDTRFVGAGALHLIAVRGRTLLIGSTTQQVNLLMDLTESAQAASSFDRVLETAKPFQPKLALQDETTETQQTLQQFRARLNQARQRLGA